VRKSRFKEEQIIAILKEAEAGKKVSSVCRVSPLHKLRLTQHVTRAVQYSTGSA
jgi:hypothetical protein